MDDFWLDNYTHPEYYKMDHKEKSLYNSGLIEVALYYYYNRKSGKVIRRPLSSPDITLNIRQVAYILFWLIHNSGRIAYSLTHLFLLIRSFISGLRYAVSIYIDAVSEVLELFSTKPVDKGKIKGLVRTTSVFMLMLTLLFFLYRPVFYLVLFIGLLALPLKYKDDLGIIALTAVIALILLTFTLFAINFVFTHVIKI